MYWSIAHEGAGGDQLVLLVHVALADTLAHVPAAQLVDGRGSVSSVRVPRKRKKEACQILTSELGEKKTEKL